MDIVATSMTVADYVQAMARKEIQVDPDYQRSPKIWPPAARSYLIETLLLRLPVPKLSLHQKTDVKTKQVIKFVVDGQQRSRAIQDFYHDRLRLSRALETEGAQGRLYSQLDEELQQRFLDYQLTIDLFVGARPEEIRDVFRRMNSYTIPLNAEEQRHARFQGEFKWFVQSLCKQFGALFLTSGIFPQKQLVRMQDTKLIAEVVHALLHGITTTGKRQLDQLYRNHENEFAQRAQIASSLTEALDQLAAWSDLHNTPLVKPYVVYSLLLAIIHVRHQVPELAPLTDLPQEDSFVDELVLANLSSLAAALESADEFSSFGDFIAACSGRTNVADQRKERFRWMCAALQPELLG